VAVSCQPSGAVSPGFRKEGVTAEIASLSCDRSGVAQNVGVQQIASAQSSLTRIIGAVSGTRVPEPMAEVSADTELVVSDPADLVTLGSYYTFASAGVAGFMRINETAPPPTGVATIPIILRSAGETRLDSTFLASSAFVRSTLAAPDGSVLVDVSASDGGGFRIARSVPMEVGALHRFEIMASCTSAAGRHPYVAQPVLGNDCGAVVDPRFELDQAAFDEAMGAASFALADFFAVDLSANILAAVPEPGPLGLLAAGLAGLAARARARG
jgi:hypothetical protein